MKGNKNMENNISKQKMFVFVVFVLVLMTVFLIIANQLKKNQALNQANKTEISPPATVNKTKTGGLELILKESARPKLGQAFSLVILADSNNKNITGFDALVGYDKTAFEFVNAVGIKEDFKALTFNNSDWITINGSRRIQYNQPVAFSNSELVEINFKPLKTGQFDFSIIESKGNEKTQMVDTDSKIIYPKASSLMVEVQ